MIAKYIVRRLVHATLLLVAISFLSFALLEMAPGDYFDALRMNPQISAQTINGIRSEYGLDRPLLIRYQHWLLSVFNGQMGYSIAYHTPVGPLLSIRARNTLLLTGISTTLAWLLAIPIGVWSAKNRGSWGDRAGGLLTSTFLTIPDLLLFLCLLLVAVKTGWFPAGGMTSPGEASFGFWSKTKDIALHLFLPGVGLALGILPMLVRHIRSAMIEVLESPFIRAARGHGISARRVLYCYALPVAANPLISLLGFSLGTMLSASVMVEVILSWPGLGPLLVEAIFARDVYVVIGVVMLSSLFLVAGNLVADVLLFANDPRIRVE